MMYTIAARTACLLLVLSGLGVAAFAQEYQLARYTIDNGGTMFSKDGSGFEVSATIGQPDAGTMVGEGYEVSGGFWFPVSPADCNDDGVVGLPDYKNFGPCLNGPGGLSAEDGCHCFDVDQDGFVTMADFSMLQVQFVGQ